MKDVTIYAKVIVLGDNDLMMAFLLEHYTYAHLCFQLLKKVYQHEL